MSTLVHYIKDVRSGFGDYFTDTHLLTEENQSIDMEFNQDFTLEDAIVETEETLASGDVFELSLVYPQSGRTGVLSTISASGSPSGPLRFFLNSTNDNMNVLSGARNGSGKQWYRVAPRTLLRVKWTSKSSTSLRVRFSAIGHSGNMG